MTSMHGVVAVDAPVRPARGRFVEGRQRAVGRDLLEQEPERDAHQHDGDGDEHDPQLVLGERAGVCGRWLPATLHPSERPLPPHLRGKPPDSGYERHRTVLLRLAGDPRRHAPSIAVPLAPLLYEDHIAVLVLLRPSKEVLLLAGS